MSAGEPLSMPIGPAEAEAVELTAAAHAGPRGLRAFLRIREGAIGAAMLAVVLLVVVAGPLVAPYEPSALSGTPAQPPSSAHLLGTDALGRDVLSRLLSGGASVVLLPLAAVGAAIAIAVVLGLLSGYLGGFVDGVVTRTIDIALAIPPFLTVLVILAGFGTGSTVVVIAVAVVYVPSIARVLRAATQSIRPREFVLAARARGDSVRWIVFREIAPNLLATLLVEIALRLTFAIMFIASLSFLGLGVQPPSPNWGVMVGENRGLMFSEPLAVLAPALAIAMLAIAINLLADALTQYFGDDSTSEVML
jgi:peptide/nickel transport system permease protein